MRKRPTIADLRALKGKKQLTMLRVITLEEAEAAERAKIDIVSIPPDLLLHPQYRDAAPTLFSMPGENFYEIGNGDDFVRWAFRMYKASADAVYCSASFATVKRMADEAIPVIGHVGLIPSRATWTGGFRAVGKTASSAIGAIPRCQTIRSRGRLRRGDRSRSDRSRQSDFGAHVALHVVDGSGNGMRRAISFCGGHPRSESRPHAPAFQGLWDAAAEYDRLQAERIAAFSEYVADVNSGTYPEEKHILHIDPSELQAFLKLVDDHREGSASGTTSRRDGRCRQDSELPDRARSKLGRWLAATDSRVNGENLGLIRAI